MAPRDILSTFSPEHSLQEVSDALFDLMDKGRIDVTKDHEFYNTESNEDGS
jgi:hypothetical protein